MLHHCLCLASPQLAERTPQWHAIFKTRLLLLLLLLLLLEHGIKCMRDPLKHGAAVQMHDAA
jgi:hypothetical protein